MSEKREMPRFMGSNDRDAGLPRAEINAEEEDVYAQLAQKERDLILAAELGKALLDSNQELQSRYDQMVEEYLHKVEKLQQEKYDLHLELEKMGTEYQNAIKDMQDDLSALRKQARASDELQITERERSRSLREAQQNSDYLMEQVKKASLREEEIMKELEQLKMKNDSSCATIKDQIDHIAMLRDQVEYLSEKLRETNKKLQEIQEEKNILINTLEIAQENTHVLEVKLSEQEVKIQRQSSDIDELQETNADLLQQLQQRQSLQYHHQHQHRVPYLSSRNSSSTKHNSQISGNKQNPHNLFFELNQEKQKQSHYSQPLPNQQQKQDQHVEGQDQFTHSNTEIDKCDKPVQAGHLTKTYEPPFSSELAQRDNGRSNNNPSLLAEFISMCHHSRNTGDCSICCLTEGSRKRHHQNVGGSSDDDEDASDSGPKQTLYSESRHSDYNPHAGSASSTMDNNGNQILQIETHSSYRTDISRYSASTDLTQRRSTNLHEVLHDTLADSESFQKSSLPHNTFLNDSQENATFRNLTSQFEDTPFSSGENMDKTFSELSTFTREFYPRQQEMQEQSLFSELSSQLYDDRHGTGSDSSSNCMLGVFDFSGSDVQDVDRNSNESLNRSMEIRSRIESDLSCVTDWYYMTPVTSEMLEEDDFECDDDDFLIGNMAGTTLSISNGDHGLRYNYHGYISRENMADHECSALGGDVISCSEKQGSTDHNKQAQLSEACRQLKELVIRVQGEGRSPVSKTHVPYEDFAEAGTDVLLSLVAEMRLCIDKLSAEKEAQLQSFDISTTDEVANVESSCNTECLQYKKQSLQHQKHHLYVADWHSFTENEAHRDDTCKQMRKSKSSSSLI